MNRKTKNMEKKGRRNTNNRNKGVDRNKLNRDSTQTMYERVKTVTDHLQNDLDEIYFANEGMNRSVCR